MRLGRRSGLGRIGEFVIRESVVRSHLAQQALHLRAPERIGPTSRFKLYGQITMPGGDGPQPVRMVTLPPHLRIELRSVDHSSLCRQYLGHATHPHMKKGRRT